MSEKQMKCDDCKQSFPERLIDAWAKSEHAHISRTKYLCEKCHAARPPSALGPWEAAISFEKEPKILTAMGKE